MKTKKRINAFYHIKLFPIFFCDSVWVCVCVWRRGRVHCVVTEIAEYAWLMPLWFSACEWWSARSYHIFRIRKPFLLLFVLLPRARIRKWVRRCTRLEVTSNSKIVMMLLWKDTFWGETQSRSYILSNKNGIVSTERARCACVWERVCVREQSMG